MVKLSDIKIHLSPVFYHRHAGFCSDAFRMKLQTDAGVKFMCGGLNNPIVGSGSNFKLFGQVGEAQRVVSHRFERGRNVFKNFMTKMLTRPYFAMLRSGGMNQFCPKKFANCLVSQTYPE